MRSTAFVLMIITIISKVFGLLRQVTLSSLYALGDVASAFITAQTIPVVLVAFIASGLSTGFIPTYHQVVKRHGRAAGDRFTSNVNNIVVLIMVVLVVLSQVFTSSLIKLFASGYEGYRLQLTIQFTRIAMLSMIPSIMAAVFRGYLNANNHFYVQNLQGFILNIFLISSLVLSYVFENTWILAFGLVLAISLQYVIYIPVVRKQGFHYHRGINWRDPYVRKLLFLALPVIFGSAINQINIIIDQNVASVVSDKGVAMLQYASRLTEFANGIIITTIATVAFPELSRRVIEKDMKGLKRSIQSSLSTIMILVVPSILGLMMFSRPIVSMVFEYGRFTYEDAQMTAVCLYFYAVSLIGIAVREMVSKTFYSLNDTKTPTINSVFMVLVNVLGNLTLPRFMGVPGLALATSLAAVLGSITLTIQLRRKIGSFGRSHFFLVEMGKMLLAALAMALASRGAFQAMLAFFGPDLGRRQEALALVLAIGLAMLVYFLGLRLLKVRELDHILAGFRRKKKARTARRPPRA